MSEDEVARLLLEAVFEAIDFKYPGRSIAEIRAALSGVPEDAATDRSPDHLPQGVGVSNFPNRKCEACGEPWPCPNAYKPAALRSVPSPEPLDVLAAQIDRHWLEQEVDGDPAIAACSCGEWRFDARTCGLTFPQMGEHFYPFSEHIAAAILAAPQPVPEDVT